jgi:hypothetical protein
MASVRGERDSAARGLRGFLASRFVGQETAERTRLLSRGSLRNAHRRRFCSSRGGDGHRSSGVGDIDVPRVSATRDVTLQGGRMWRRRASVPPRNNPIVRIPEQAQVPAKWVKFPRSGQSAEHSWRSGFNRVTGARPRRRRATGPPVPRSCFFAPLFLGERVSRGNTSCAMRTADRLCAVPWLLSFFGSGSPRSARVARGAEVFLSRGPPTIGSQWASRRGGIFVARSPHD